MKKLNCLFMSLAANLSMDNDTVPNVRNMKFSKKMKVEKDVWDEVTEYAANNGFNSVLIDLGDGVKYKSHPEIAVEGAWEPEYLKEELNRLRKLGLTPYPKLNFSAGHDAWLGIYSRMVSTPEYYKVCEELIDEVMEIFDYPELFHLGLDEEDAINQQKVLFVCFRQHDLIWHDVKFFFNCVKKHNVRPWIWYDYYHTHTEDFIKNVPTDVVVSPWYYSYLYGDCSAPLPDSEQAIKKRASFRELSELGYDLVPTCSNFANTFNMDHIVRYTEENVVPDKNKGILTTSWCHANDRWKFRILDSIQATKYALKENGVEI